MTQYYTVKTNFNIMNAQNFIDSFNYETITSGIKDTKLYAFIGHTQPWTNESDIPVPDNSLENTIDCWNDMIAFKRVNSSDMTLGLRRINWTYGTVYYPWDSEDGTLIEKDFYVLTSDYRVYICLDNNNGAISTIKPENITTSTFTTSDGYKWKFMYEISAADVEKWNDIYAIPVEYLTSNNGSLQWQVQQAAVPGTIDYIEVLDGGTGYLSAPTITITGDGTNAAATAIINGGVITKITITNPGSGYTRCNISVSGNASLRPILSPIAGHGSNPVQELGGKYIIASFDFDKDESSTFPTNVSYRQIGLLVDPLLYGTTAEANISAGSSQTTSLIITSDTGSFTQNETITGNTSGATARVISYNSTNSILYINNVNGTFVANETIIGQTSLSQAEVSSITNPVLKLYSGNMIYVENRAAITRSPTQTENLKLVIKW